jgi:hypothetical protein
MVSDDIRSSREVQDKRDGEVNHYREGAVT